jgi:hypothetical protein
LVAHLVLFRPRATLGEVDRAALSASFARALAEIPGVRRARVGRRVTHGRPYERLMAEHYEYAAVLEFDDVAGLKRYLEHPAHEELGARFFASFEVALIYDYEMRDAAEASTTAE